MARFSQSDPRPDRGAVRGPALSIPLAILIASAILLGRASRSQATEPLPDRQTLREILDRHWQSLDTLEFFSELFNIDEAGTRDIGGGYSRIHYAIGSGGRRCYELWGVWPDRTRRARTVREDGHRRYGIQAFKDGEDAIDEVFISNPKNTHDENEDSMTPAMFGLTPLGRPLSYYLKDSAEIAESLASDGEKLVSVKVSTTKGVLSFELDPSHDWLARRVVLDRGLEFQVTRFRRDNGRWFPEEGRFDLGKGKAVQRQLFTVANLSINRPIDPSLFVVSTAALPPGVIVNDAFKENSEIVGGFEAREALERKHQPTSGPDSNPKVSKVVDKPLSEARTPSSMLVPGLLLGLGMGSFVVAAVLVARQRHIAGR